MFAPHVLALILGWCVIFALIGQLVGQYAQTKKLARVDGQPDATVAVPHRRSL